MAVLQCTLVVITSASLVVTLDLGGNNITNLKSGGNVTNNAANIGDVVRISKTNDLHVAPTAGTNNNVAGIHCRC